MTGQERCDLLVQGDCLIEVTTWENLTIIQTNLLSDIKCQLTIFNYTFIVMYMYKNVCMWFEWCTKHLVILFLSHYFILNFDSNGFIVCRTKHGFFVDK